MNIEQFELILCDMYTMDAWSPPLLWKWKKEFKEASTKQWAISELTVNCDCIEVLRGQQKEGL